jgi:hypothetical protein
VTPTYSVALRATPEGFRNPDTLIHRILERSLQARIRIVDGHTSGVDIAVTSTHPQLWRRGLETVRRTAAMSIPRRRTRPLASQGDLLFREPMRSARANVWFSGENVRPPTGSWDLTLSHDLDPLGGTNLYFPYWMEAVGSYAQPTVNFLGHDHPSPIEMLQPRPTDWSRRTGFACAFIGKPTGMRMHAIRALKELGEVSVFGPAVGRPVRNKANIARQFRFVVCFENDLYPGYVTEKPFDAWAVGAIPLWWGSDPAGYLNPEALLNYADDGSLADFTERVAALMDDRVRGQWVSEQPLLVRVPDFESLESRIRSRLLPLLGGSDAP